MLERGGILGDARDQAPANASGAGMRRPSSIMSAARVSPAMRATRWLPPLPGIWPSITSGNASKVSLVAMRMSQAMASSSPTPIAYFSITQITGLGQRCGAAMFQARSRHAVELDVRKRFHVAARRVDRRSCRGSPRRARPRSWPNASMMALIWLRPR